MTLLRHVMTYSLFDVFGCSLVYQSLMARDPVSISHGFDAPSRTMFLRLEEESRRYEEEAAWSRKGNQLT